MDLSQSISTCVDLLSRSQRIVVLTGAGISTSAGIADFRGPQGLYTSRIYDAEKVFDIEYFLKDPKPFYEFARDFIGLEKTLEPTSAHRVLAQLESAGKLTAIVTQNIDGLHHKAGSQKVLEMHGSFRSSHCLRCRKVFDFYELKMMLTRLGTPHCECRGLIKPDIVFFGENVKHYSDALQLAETADLFFVVGTSCSVYPAASLPQFVPGKIIIVNQDEVQLNMYNIAVTSKESTDYFFIELAKALAL